MISETIQLSLTPVFMLVAVGNLLNVLTGRLARIVDRSRKLQEQHTTSAGTELDAVVLELQHLNSRIRLVNRSILLLVVSAILVGTTVALLFVEGQSGLHTDGIIAGCYILTVGTFLSALIMFLIETRIATQDLKIPARFLKS